MATTSSLGIGTGVDLQGMLKSIMSAERAPITALDTKITAANSKISVFGTLKSKLDTLQSAAETLQFPSRLSAVTAESSDSSVLGSSAAFTATPGSYQAVVTQLAKAQKNVSTGYGTSTTFGPGNLDFTVGGTPAASITFEAGMTLEQVSTRINGAKIGVTATLINTSDGNQRMVLTSDKSGASNGFSLEATSLLPATSGIGLTTFDGGYAQVAQDAKMTLDGLEISSSTNTFASSVSGLTLTAVKEGTSTITVKNDESKITSAVQAFVDAYNAVTTTIKTNSTYNAATKTAQAFSGEASIRSVQNGLSDTRTLIPPELSTGNITKLSDLGISVQQTGLLTLDKAKLTAAIGTSASAVTNALSAYGKSFSEKIAGMLDSGGVFTNRVSSLNSSVTRFKDNQANLEVRVALVEKRYRAQFTALDKLVSSMQSTSSYLTQQLASLAK